MQRGYIGILMMLVATAIIGGFYFLKIYPSGNPLPGMATTTADGKPKSYIEMELDAVDSARAASDISTQRAKQINGYMGE